MLGFNPYHLEEAIAQLAQPGHPRDVEAFHVARRRYDRAVLRAHGARLWAALRGKPNRLLDLTAVEASASVLARSYAGARIVPIRRIRGSEGRTKDFDQAFHPLRPHSRERWIRLAVAWQLGLVAPPVELIRVGDLYFVRDGHHRISVARAFGQEYVDAVVTLWQVAGALPWEPATEAPGWTGALTSS